MVLMFFNEKSCVSDCSQDEAGQAMRDFVKVCQAVRRVDNGSSLVSEVRLEDLEIAPGYYLAQWRNENQNRDHWQFMRLLNRKSPHSTVLPPPPEDQEVEYRHDGDRVLGLAAAHLMETLAVSLPTARPWEASWLRVEYSSSTMMRSRRTARRSGTHRHPSTWRNTPTGYAIARRTPSPPARNCGRNARVSSPRSSSPLGWRTT